MKSSRRKKAKAAGASKQEGHDEVQEVVDSRSARTPNVCNGHVS